MTYQHELHDFLQRAQEITAQMEAAKARIAQREVVGASEGGAVQLTMTPEGQVRSVRIAPKALADVSRLEHLVGQAVQNALENVRKTAEELVGPLADNLARLKDG